MQPLNILLVQLAANGDCLFVTTIAKQIKEIDYPGSHLSWMIGSKYIQVLENNPYVDEIIEIPITKGREEITSLINSIPQLIEKEREHKKYDKVFITDFTPSNYKNWYGTTRSSLFRSYPHQLKINPEPLIFLTDNEKSRVKEFCNINNITPATYNILFECAPQSGQSHMTFDLAMEIAKEVSLKNDRVKFIMSSPQKFESGTPNIIDGSAVSWRENAELINYCNLLVGCSSGISWLCTSNYSNIKPTIQIIDPGYMKGKFSASMKMDFKYFGIDTGNTIELHNPADKIIIECILLSAADNFHTAQRKYDVSDNNCFRNLSFLKAAKIPLYQKLFFAIRFHFLTSVAKVYRKVQPAWFKPGIWIKKIVRV